MINLKIFKDHNFSLANLIVFIFGIGMFGSTFLIPLYMQDSLGYSAYQTGLFFLPVGFLQAVASPLAGNASRWVNPKGRDRVGIVLVMYQFLHELFFLLSDR